MILHMFDNNNDQIVSPSRPSSGLELQLSFGNYSVSLVRRLIDPEVFIATQLTGGYQRLPGHHAFVDFGIPPYFREWDEDGNLVYATQVGPVNRSDVYRAYKQEWVGRPQSSPKLVARAGGNGQTQVWMSWNGATEVGSWTVYAGNDANSLTKLVTLEKEYFETHGKLPGVYQSVQAKALDANGTVLGQSPAVTVD